MLFTVQVWLRRVNWCFAGILLKKCKASHHLLEQFSLVLFTVLLGLASKKQNQACRLIFLFNLLQLPGIFLWHFPASMAVEAGGRWWEYDQGPINKSSDQAECQKSFLVFATCLTPDPHGMLMVGCMLTPALPLVCQAAFLLQASNCHFWCLGRYPLALK